MTTWTDCLPSAHSQHHPLGLRHLTKPAAQGLVSAPPLPNPSVEKFKAAKGIYCLFQPTPKIYPLQRLNLLNNLKIANPSSVPLRYIEYTLHVFLKV